MTSAPRLMWLPPALNLALAALQILYLGPVLAADALSLALGVTWSLAIAIAWPSLSPGNRRLGAGYLLMSTGPLLMAYSRDLLLLYLGWEVVGLGLWLALTSAETNRSGRRALALALHVPGWLLLVVALLGLAPSFVAPAGGEAQA